MPGGHRQIIWNWYELHLVNHKVIERLVKMQALFKQRSFSSNERLNSGQGKRLNQNTAAYIGLPYRLHG